MEEQPTRKISITLFVICAVAILLLANFSLVIRSDQQIANRPFEEDAYYSLSIARNIARGYGITIDGSMLTNGFQPLFTFLTIPAFWLSYQDTYLALRYVFVIHWCVYFLTACILALIIRDAILEQDAKQKQLHFWLTVLVYVSNVWIMLTHFNGLETGFLLCMYALLWRYYQKGYQDNNYGRVMLGILLGLLILTRIDTVFFVIIFLVFLMLHDNSIELLLRIKNISIIAFSAFLISSPWWAYNLFVFGSLMPTSGMAQYQLDITTERIFRAIDAFSTDVFPWLYLSRLQINNVFVGLAASAIRVLCVVAGLVFIKRATHGQLNLLRAGHETTTRRAMNFAFCLLLANSALFLWYMLSSRSSHAYGRYLAPLFLIGAAIASCFLWSLVRRFPAAVPWIATACCLPYLASMYVLHANYGIKGNINYTEQLPLVNQHVPAGDYVGAGQTGTLGFFREKVVNLDGKVNPEALRNRSIMQQYLLKQNLFWFCDWSDLAPVYLGKNPENNGWMIVARKGRSVLYHYEKNVHSR